MKVVHPVPELHSRHRRGRSASFVLKALPAALMLALALATAALSEAGVPVAPGAQPLASGRPEGSDAGVAVPGEGCCRKGRRRGGQRGVSAHERGTV